MTVHMTAAAARSVAESLWGMGGTHAFPTNRKGAWWYSCSSHGGMIVDGGALSAEEREAIEPYITPEQGTVYNSDGAYKTFMHPYRDRGSSLRGIIEVHKVDFYVFEEDVAWAIAGHKLGIGRKDHVEDPTFKEVSQAAFWNTYDETNPRVIAGKKADKARAEMDPDLICSAARQGDRVKVYTASKESWLVDGYADAKDENGTPWLHLCKNPVAIDWDSGLPLNPEPVETEDAPSM